MNSEIQGQPHLVTVDQRPMPSQEVRAALDAVPGGRFSRYELPMTTGGAARVMVSRGGAMLRVYVDPRDLHPMAIVDEDQLPMNVVSRLHGELLLGERGSALVEVAGSWGIVMIITGVCLWWPHGRWQAAGWLYPRLGLRGRSLWRELHSVAGIWISLITLLLLLSGLPWTANWGNYLTWVRGHWEATQGMPDWPIGGSDPGESRAAAADGGDPRSFQPLDRLVPLAAAMALPGPVWIAPPAPGALEWTISSHTQNRPQRMTLQVDPDRASIIARQTFGDLNIVDRIVNVGVAAHEGQLFGWANQVLLLINAAGIVLIAVSASLMWWRRRPAGYLGAPSTSTAKISSGPLAAVVLGLAVLLPLFGLTLLAVLVIEVALLRRMPMVARWLGLPV